MGGNSLIVGHVHRKSGTGFRRERQAKCRTGVGNWLQVCVLGGYSVQPKGKMLGSDKAIALA